MNTIKLKSFKSLLEVLFVCEKSSIFVEIL